MKLYRYMTESELNAFNLNDLTNVGSVFDKTTGHKYANTHCYEEGVKYLHFFKNKSDIKFMRSMYKEVEKEFYICEFDVPVLTALKYRGKGIYDMGGYDTDRVYATEYAIPVFKLKPEYLVAHKFDNQHYLQQRSKDNIKE
ncbi:MAG: hypothetical protein E7361_03185 [Clostridiales bacterium]|nr:hypothetical protein [Clostridiales bacterium]